MAPITPAGFPQHHSARHATSTTSLPTPTARTTITTDADVTASNTFTANNYAAFKLDPANASTTPIAMPAPTKRIPFITSTFVSATTYAPSMTRIPNSLLCCAAMLEVVPLTPSAASTSAAAANARSSIAANRARDVASHTTSLLGRAVAIDVGAPHVRIALLIVAIAAALPTVECTKSVC